MDNRGLSPKIKSYISENCDLTPVLLIHKLNGGYLSSLSKRCLDSRGYLISRATIMLLFAFCVWHVDVSRAADQGYIGDNLSRELASRSVNTGEKFIFTRKALIKERQIGARELLNSYSKKVKMWGWTLIYLPDEDVSEIRRRVESNRLMWEPMLEKHSFSAIAVKNELPGIDIIVVNKIFTHTCKIDLKINLPQPVYVVIYDMNGTPRRDLCRDYMLMLAANDVSVRLIDNKLVADLLVAESEGLSP